MSTNLYMRPTHTEKGELSMALRVALEAYFASQAFQITNTNSGAMGFLEGLAFYNKLPDAQRLRDYIAKHGSVDLWIE